MNDARANQEQNYFLSGGSELPGDIYLSEVISKHEVYIVILLLYS